MAPSVLIIILCYNGIHDTLACLESLHAVDYPTSKVSLLVLDNASTDSTPQVVRQRFPNVTVIENGGNLGFAGGNNVGLRYALQQGYDYALLLNNDTEVAPDFLRILVEAAESDPQIGVVGPTITYYERPDLIWSAGGWIDWRHGCVIGYNTNEVDTGQFQAPRQVDYVTGCALLVKRKVLEQAGLLDERFFMYYEETEWCVRIGRAGFTVMHIPAAKVLHKIPLNARFDKEYLAYYMTRNRLLFLRATAANSRAWFNAIILQDLRTFISLYLRPKWRTRPGRHGIYLGYLDFWRGRFGRLETTL